MSDSESDCGLEDGQNAAGVLHAAEEDGESSVDVDDGGGGRGGRGGARGRGGRGRGRGARGGGAAAAHGANYAAWGDLGVGIDVHMPPFTSVPGRIPPPHGSPPVEHTIDLFLTEEIKELIKTAPP